MMSLIPEKFSAADIVVIATLWTLQFYDNWLTSLFIHSSDVIYGELKESQFYQNADFYVIVGKCILACALAFVVDAYNHKYGVAFGGMGLYMITPVLALTMCITEKREFLVLTLCASSLLFVTSPAAFGVIFNQNKRPVRIQVRRLVAIMEFAQGMLLVMVAELIPETASHSERNSMVASWVVMVPLIIFIITILDRLRQYVRTEDLRERGVVAIFKGIRHDVSGRSPRTGLSVLNVLVFVLLLLPAFSLTSLETVVSNLKPTDDTQFQHPSLKRIVTAAQLTAIPVTEVAISFAPLKEMVAELVVLGLAHVLNIGVLTVLCVQIIGSGGHRPVMNVQLPNNHSTSNLDLITTTESPSSTFDKSATFSQSINIIRGKRALPDGHFLFIIVNHSPFGLKIIEDPQGMLLNGGVSLTGYLGIFIPSGPRRISGIDITINLEMTEIGSMSQHPQKINQAVTFKNKMFRYIGLWGTSKLAVSLGGDDVDIPQFLDPSLSMIIVQNTIVGNSYFGQVMKPNEHEIEILTTGTSTTLAIERLPKYSESLRLMVPASKPGQPHVIYIRYRGDDPALKGQLKRGITLAIDCQSGKVNVVSFGIRETPPLYLTTSGQIYDINNPPTLPTTAPPESTSPGSTPPGSTSPGSTSPGYTSPGSTPPGSTPPGSTPPGSAQPDVPDGIVASSFGVFGVILGMTTVGYIHFFWMEAPVRLRTTLYAWFIVSNELLSWLTSHIVGNEVGITEAIILLSIAIITAIWHFFFGWYYQRHFATKPELPRRLS